MVFLGDRGALKGSPRISMVVCSKPPSTHPHPLAKEKRSPRNSRPTGIGDPPGMVTTHHGPTFDVLPHFIDRKALRIACFWKHPTLARYTRRITRYFGACSMVG